MCIVVLVVRVETKTCSNFFIKSFFRGKKMPGALLLQARTHKIAQVYSKPKALSAMFIFSTTSGLVRGSSIHPLMHLRLLVTDALVRRSKRAIDGMDSIWYS